MPSSVTYDITKNELVFKENSKIARRADIYIHNDSTVFPYWREKSSAKTTAQDSEKWFDWEDAEKAAVDLEDYDSSWFSITRIFPKDYPAFPFDSKTNPIEIPNIAPRGFLKITYRSNPAYFAIVSCFPGVGDNDFYSRPLVVGDAFDPTGARGAFEVFFGQQYRNLLQLSGTLTPRLKGYDVFFLDFAQGAGNLHLNAMIETKLIEWLSRRARERIVVAGMSMGAVLGRLALLYTLPENNRQNSDLGRKVKGFLSLDAPHQGANLTGLFLRQIYSLIEDNVVIGDALETARGYRDMLNTPAAHQMLYEHYYLDERVVNSRAHDAFYGFLEAKGGYRKDIPKVAIAYSNFYRPHPGYAGPWNWGVAVIGDCNLACRTVNGNAYEFQPGSTGYWFHSSYEGKSPNYMDPSWIGNPAEKFKGTFIPIVSALDLKHFDPMNPPTLDRIKIKAYSPFDAVHYMEKEYNGYCNTGGECKKLSLNDTLGAYRTSIEDKRYEHIIFDAQVMRAVEASLRSIESLDWNRTLLAGRGMLLNR